jgi:hypothetical protein
MSAGSSGYSDVSDDRVPTTSSHPHHKYYTPEELKSRGIGNVEIYAEGDDGCDAIIIKSWRQYQKFLLERLTDGYELW